MSPRFRELGVLLFVAIALCAQKVAPVRSAHWEPIGPGGGGALFHPAISPADRNTIAVACDMTGSYITQNGGVSWQTFNLRGAVQWFVFDPRDPKTLYAKSNALWHTRDAGKNWEVVYPPRAAVRGVTFVGDHAAERLVTTASGSGQITALAVDPGRSATLYASFRREIGNTLQMSIDSGKTWAKLAALPSPAENIFVRPAKGSPLLLASSSYMAEWNGHVLTTLPMPETSAPVRSLAAGFRGDGNAIVYAVANDAIFVKHASGAWIQSSFPISGASIRVIATSLHHPEIAYASFTNQASNKAAAKASFGIACTRDAGKKWEVVWDQAQRPVANSADDWIAQTFGAGYAGSPTGLAVDANDPNLVYATDLGRALRSTDGGKTWTATYAHAPASGSSGIGMELTTSYGVHFDPFNPQHVLVSYTDIGLMSSTDRGKSWKSAVQGVPRAWQNTTYWVTFDPSVRGRVWAVMSKTHDLPRPKMWARRSTDEYDGGVVRSNDGGATWTVSNHGMSPTAPTHLLLDPASPAEARVLYVAAMGRGIYKSTDSGKNWMLKNNGISQSQPLVWRLVRDSRGALYLIVARRSDDGSIGNSSDGALYRSTDGAEHWTKVNLPEGVNGPNGLAIDPASPQRLYLAAWGRSLPKKSLGGGIFLSTDAGAHWQPLLTGDQHIYDVTVDDRNPKILYAAGFEAAAWRSADAGKTWRRIRGFDFKWAHRVIPDPADPGLIYVTTFGGGVWHGPAAGDPSAPELPLPR